MRIWSLILGILLLLLCVYDIVWTTLSASETGPMTLRIVRFHKWLSKVFRRMRGVHRILRVIGIMTFLTSLFVWYVMLWFSFGLIFSSVDGSIVRSSDNNPSSHFEKFYFVGYIVFTAGLGDYKPTTIPFQFCTIIANCLGLFLVAITVSYLVTATDAVTKHRHLAARIGGLGKCPVDILRNSWNGQDMKVLDTVFSDLANDITLCAQLFVRFPIIFNFHNIEVFYTPAVKLAVIDEVITIMQCCIKTDVGVANLSILQLKNALDSYFKALHVVGIYENDSEDVPNIPDLSSLQQWGIPMSDMGTCYSNFNKPDCRKRRKLLHFIIKENTRSWQDTKCHR